MEREGYTHRPEMDNWLNSMTRQGDEQAEILDTEKQKAADDFNELIDNTLMQHIMDVQHYPLEYASGVQLVPKINKGSLWTVKLLHRQELPDSQLKLPASEQYTREISLYEENINKCDAEQCDNIRSVSYRLGVDNVVRRVNGDLWGADKTMREFYRAVDEKRDTDGDAEDAQIAWQGALKYMREERSFNEAMGKYDNNKPVSLEEIKLLGEFINSSEFRD